MDKGMAYAQRYEADTELMAQVRVKRGSMNYILDLANIRQNGAFLQTSLHKKLSHFRVGQELELDIFELEALDNIRVKGEIVRLVDAGDPVKDGFAVQFTDIPDDIRSDIQSLITGASKGAIRPPPLPAN